MVGGIIIPGKLHLLKYGGYRAQGTPLKATRCMESTIVYQKSSDRIGKPVTLANTVWGGKCGTTVGCFIFFGV